MLTNIGLQCIATMIAIAIATVLYDTTLLLEGIARYNLSLNLSMPYKALKPKLEISDMDPSLPGLPSSDPGCRGTMERVT